MKNDNKINILQFSRYSAIGAMNTLLTGAVIFFLLQMYVNPYISNAVGFIVGMMFSYVLNSHYTFKIKLSLQRSLKFIVNCTICYILNIITLSVIIPLFLKGSIIPHLAGMIIYTITGFLLNKKWVMN